jgi:predicted aconitase with swiveling domain
MNVHPAETVDGALKDVLDVKVIVNGACDAPAMVTRQPINFTAAMCKPPNILPSKRAEVRDGHHELFRQNVGGRALVFPACIGSTHTGLVLLDLVSLGHGPAALIVQSCDSLLISGVILSEVWFGPVIPIVEYPGDDLFDRIANGDRIVIAPGAVRLHVYRAGVSG